MTQCEMIQERMPDIMHRRAAWGAAELAHLGDCADCAAEWRLIEAGAALHQNLVVDAEAILSQLRDRITATPATAVLAFPRRRAGWGLLAAAASIALVFGLRHDRPLPRVTPAAATALLPELDQLSEAQLEAVLNEVEVSDDAATPMRLPRLGDLNETQLEQMLRELEG